MRLSAFLTWWAARPPRERWILMALPSVVLFALWDVLLGAPLGKKVRAAQAQVTSVQERLNEATKDAASKAPQATALLAQESTLQQRLAQARAQAAQARRWSVQSAGLHDTVRTLTQAAGAVQWVGLDMSGEAAAGKSAGEPANAKPPQGALHRLPVTLRVNGSYAELQALMQRLEQEAQALQWTGLSLNSSRWPSVELTLKAYVYSTEPRWGGGS